MFTPGDSISPRRLLPVKNTGDEEAPAQGVVMVVSPGIDADGVIPVARPDADGVDPRRLMVVYDAAIPAGGYGQATPDWPCWAKCEATGSGSGSGAGGLPATGDEVGTEANSWLLHAGQAGFVVWAADDATDAVYVQGGNTLVCAEGGSGSGCPSGTPLDDLIQCDGSGNTQIRNVCLAVNVCGRLYPVVALDPDTGEVLNPG